MTLDRPTRAFNESSASVTGGWSPSAVEALALATVGAAYLLLRMLTFRAAGVLASPDTEGWMTLGWLVRPPVVPLLWELCGDRPSAIAALHFAVSVSSWLILAFSAAAVLRASALRWLAVLAVLGFSLDPDILLWDKVLLSESLSLSLLALVLSGWLAVAKRWTTRRAVAFTLAATGFSLCRDTNAWAGLGAAAAGCSVALWKRSSRRPLLLPLIFVPLFAVSSWTQDAGERWLYPLLNVLSTRMLTDPDRTEYFRARGLPVTPALTSSAGLFATDLERSVPAPDFAALVSWTREEGKRSYARFLLDHPDVAVNVPIRNIERLLTLIEESYQPPGFRPVLPTWVSEALYPERLLLLWLVYGSTALLGATLARTSVRTHPLGHLGCIAIILAYPQFALAWHGDSMDPGRHALGAGVEFRLGFWFLVLAWLDRSVPGLRPSPGRTDRT